MTIYCNISGRIVSGLLLPPTHLKAELEGSMFQPGICEIFPQESGVSSKIHWQ